MWRVADPQRKRYDWDSSLDDRKGFLGAVMSKRKGGCWAAAEEVGPDDGAKSRSRTHPEEIGVRTFGLCKLSDVRPHQPATHLLALATRMAALTLTEC